MSDISSNPPTTYHHQMDLLGTSYSPTKVTMYCCRNYNVHGAGSTRLATRTLTYLIRLYACDTCVGNYTIVSQIRSYLLDTIEDPMSREGCYFSERKQQPMTK